MVARLPALTRAPVLSEGRRARRGRRRRRSLARDVAALAGCATRADERLAPRVRSLDPRRARATGRQGCRLRPGRRSSRVARQGHRGPARRGGGGDRRRGRGDRRRQDRRSRRPSIAAGHRPLLRPIRSSLVVTASRRDRSRTVRSGTRGPLRVVGSDVDLSGRGRAHRPVRRATRSRRPGSGLLLANPRRGLSDLDDTARSRATRR